MEYILKSLIIVGLLSFLACEKPPIAEKTIPVSENSSIVINNIIPKGTEKYLNYPSDSVFNQEKVNTYNIIINYSDLFKINGDPAKEEYVEAALVFNNDTISPIGIRYKGSIGAYLGCLSGSNWMYPTGNKVCEKLSMQLKLNWKDRKEKFYGLNKLQFHAQNYDKSQLRERLGYWLFSQMGVAAPRAVHARVLINGAYSGLYGLIEEIDNRFAEYNFPTTKGNIYKEVWPLQPNGQPTKKESFIAALKTNESTNTNIDLMYAFATEIAKTGPENAKSSINKFMDVDNITAFIVVDRAIRHDDGPFHWYCDLGGSGCYNHNYYWYENKKTQKLTLIPWDLDGTFEYVNTKGNGVTNITDNFGETSNNCDPFLYGNKILRQKSAACDKLTAAWVLYKEEYQVAKNKLQNQIIIDSKAIAQYDIWVKQIAPFVLEADKYYNYSPTLTPKATTKLVWENAASELRVQLKIAGKL